MDSRLFVYNGLTPSEKIKLPFGQLLQVAELSVVPGGEIIKHTQFCDEITYAVSGKAVFLSGDEECEVSGGQVHYIKKGVSHGIVADMNEKFRYICIGFIPDPSEPTISAFCEKREQIGDYELLSDDGSIRVLTEMLMNEIYTADSQREKMVNMYISQILISMYRLFEGNARQSKENKVSSGFTIYHALRYIDREYLNIKSVRSISEKLSYSEYYLSHLFKEKIGMSIKEYITKKKLETALSLLGSNESNMTVGEIAEFLGFSSTHSFSQSFKSRYGVSPDNYRKNNK